MKLPDKSTSMAEAVSRIPDGAVILVGGFGMPGTPFSLIHEIVRQGQKNLTLIKNDANETGMGVDHLVTSGQVKRLITSHIGLNANVIAKMNAGEIEVEFCAQGILAERIRAGGAGLGAILTDVGLGTELAEGKQQVEMDGQSYLVERAIRADVALIRADLGDLFGNLAYVATARNFNPAMAMAADLVIAEAETLLPLGGLPPDEAQTTGAFVDCVVALPKIKKEYGVVRR